MGGGHLVRPYVFNEDGSTAEVGYGSGRVPLPVSVIDGVCITANIANLTVEEPREIQAMSVDGLTVNIVGQPVRTRDLSNPPVQVSGGTLQGISSTVSVSGTVAISGQPIQVATVGSPQVSVVSGTLQGISNTVVVQAASLNGVTTSSIFSSRADVYTVAGSGTAVDLTRTPLKSYAMQVKGTGAVPTSWDARLEGSLDGSNYSQIIQHTNLSGDGAVVWSGANFSPCLYMRSRVASLTLGSAINVAVTILGTQ